MAGLIKPAFFGSLFLLILLSGSCYYDVEEDLYPDTGCDTTGVTYSGVVLPILQDNCYVCHNAASQLGGIVLEGYEQVRLQATNGNLIGAIRGQAGFTPMPLNQPPLAECVIAKIETWINNGALNN
ncbi:MAG: hypothetical protein H6563_07650 [Lewinellaceae bacterium]|nr:hypothetical protein [Lewinellaceae bacterium]